MSRFLRLLYHAIFWPRYRNNRLMKRFASTLPAGTRVLEIGSGKEVNGSHPFSAEHLFPHCEFVQSDINPAFGHRVIDIRQPGIDYEFDVVIMSSVLEHVFEYEAAIQGVLGLLRPGGVVRVGVPFLFPLHDEPNDYWRFTEHSLRRLLEDFANVKIHHEGIRRAPLGYVAYATKPQP